MRTKDMSRRKFVIGASAAAATLSLVAAGCTPPTQKKESKAETTPNVITVDEGEWIPTVCNSCFNNCSQLAHVVNGVMVEIKGDKRSPAGWGHVCAKGAAGIMQLYDPNRVTQPLKRTAAEKGIGIDPEWEEITWDEAYTLAAEMFQRAIDENKKGIISYSLITDIASTNAYQCFLAAIGASYQRFGADICGCGPHTGSFLYHGDNNSQPDYKYAKYVVQFGTQAGVNTRHGTNEVARFFAESRDNGCKLVNFDPHMSVGGEKADLWVPIRPGTDCAAVLSLTNVLVLENGVYDKEFLINRSNAPSLVNPTTGRILRDPSNNYALYWDQDAKAPVPYNNAVNPALEGDFEINGVTYKTAFTMYKEFIAEYTPEYQEKITTIPAATIRKVATELGENAHIGETIEINGYTLPYRPVAVDSFSGISRHKNGQTTFLALNQINLILGSQHAVGGFIPFVGACNGWTDDDDTVSWRPTIWEEDGLINHISASYVVSKGEKLSDTCNGSKYRQVREAKFTPSSLMMGELLPFAADTHWFIVTQAHQEEYHIDYFPRMAVTVAANPLINWGNHDEAAECLLKFKEILSVDIYLNDTTYFSDLILPEASYLERYDPLPLCWNHHRSPGNLESPWVAQVRLKPVKARDDGQNMYTILYNVAKKMGAQEKYVDQLSTGFLVKPDFRVDPTAEFDMETWLNTIYTSHFGKEYTIDWFRENGVYTHPRDVNEVYIWADGDPGRIPLYLGDLFLDCKEKIEAVIKEIDIPWDTSEYKMFPSWSAGDDYEVTDSEFDILPIYWTNAVNTDEWSVENAWLNELNEKDNSYAIEINSQTARAKGLANGDTVNISNQDGVSISGKVIVTETIHPECVAVVGGHWNLKSDYQPVAKNKGVAINELITRANTADRLSTFSAGLDQGVRCKIVKA